MGAWRGRTSRISFVSQFDHPSIHLGARSTPDFSPSSLRPLRGRFVFSSSPGASSSQERDSSTPGYFLATLRVAWSCTLPRYTPSARGVFSPLTLPCSPLRGEGNTLRYFSLSIRAAYRLLNRYTPKAWLPKRTLGQMRSNPQHKRHGRPNGFRCGDSFLKRRLRRCYCRVHHPYGDYCDFGHDGY